MMYGCPIESVPIIAVDFDCVLLCQVTFTYRYNISVYSVNLGLSADYDYLASIHKRLYVLLSMSHWVGVYPSEHSDWFGYPDAHLV